MPEYEWTVVFEAEDDEDAKRQVYGREGAIGGEGAIVSFDSVVRDELTYEDGRRMS